MKLKLAVLGLSVLALFSSGCREIDGKLFVSKEIKLIDSNDQGFLVPPGEHEAAFKLTAHGVMVMQMNNAEGVNLAFLFNIPKDMDENFRGAKVVTAKENGQNYDLALKMATDVSAGNKTTKTIQCVHHKKQAIYIGPNGHGGFSSSQNQVPVYGKQQVVVHTETVLNSYGIDFIDPQSQEVLASMYASQTVSKEVTDSEGVCVLK